MLRSGVFRVISVLTLVCGVLFASTAGAADRRHTGGNDLIRQRDVWFYGQRAYPGFTIPPGSLLRAERQASAMADSTGLVAPTAALNWSSFGPRPISNGVPSIYNGAAPWSGRVTAIAHDPTNSAIAYLGSAEGGVWKTTDSGLHWAPVFDLQPSLAIGSIAVDPGNPAIVYAGTGEPNENGDSYFGAGLFRSTNGGVSWSKIGGTTFNNCYVSKVVVQPGTSSTLLAAVGHSGRYSTTCSSGIYRSTSSGSTWTLEITGAPSDLVPKPGTPTTWYAGFIGFGVWRSTNDGVNWTQFTGATIPTSNMGRVALAVTPANPSRIYTGICAADGLAAKGVWTSTNAGTTWTQLPYRNFAQKDETTGGGQCSYDLALAAYPGLDGIVYVGGLRLMKYDGSTWTVLGYPGTTSGFIHVDIHSVNFDGQNRLWVGSDGGAYRKDSGSTSFANLNGTLGISQFYPGTSGSPSSLFLGGVQDNGSLQFTPSGGWYEIEVGDGGYTAYDASHPYKFTTYVQATVQRDPGRGCVFTSNAYYSQFYTGGCLNYPATAEPALFIAPLAQSPSSPATLYVGTNRVWKTTNDGSAWTKESPQFTGTNGTGVVSAIAQAPSTASVLYAAWSSDPSKNLNQSGPAFVALSKNANQPTPTWSGTATLPNRFITDIAVKNSAPNVAWVTLSGYNTGHVYLTQNYGASWANISGNLPNAPVNAIAVDSRTSPSTLYVATDVGVFWSTDGGTTWANTSTGLPHSVVMDIRIDTSTNKLVAGTHGRGVFTAPIP